VDAVKEPNIICQCGRWTQECTTFDDEEEQHADRNQFEATYRIPREFSRFRQAIIYAEDACAAVHLAIVLGSGAQLVGIRKVA
jgi:hypothetical protein